MTDPKPLSAEELVNTGEERMLNRIAIREADWLRIFATYDAPAARIAELEA